MSQNIRDLIHDYIENEVTDERLEEAAALLSEAGQAGHKIPLAIKVSFEVDKDGIACVKIGHTMTMKVPEWDMPLKLSGRQIDLFAPRVKTLTNSPGAEPEPVEDTRPPEHQTETPEKETPLPGLAVRQEEPEAPAPKTQEERLSAIDKRNQALLAKVDSGELELSPQAEKALREKAEQAGA